METNTADNYFRPKKNFRETVRETQKREEGLRKSDHSHTMHWIVDFLQGFPSMSETYSLRKI